jgi:AraC-like DNA-binding protein
MHIDRSQRVSCQQEAIYFQPLATSNLAQGIDAIATEAILPEGTIIIIEIRSHEYTLWWTDLTLNDDVQLTFSTPPCTSLGMVYPLKNDIHYTEERLGKGVLKKQHYFLYHLASSKCQYHLKKGAYTLFGAQFSCGYAEQWTQYFHFLQQVLEKLAANEPFFIPGNSSISTSIERIIDELYRYPSLGPGSKIFIDARALDLFCLSIRHIDNFSDNVTIPLSDYAIMKIGEAKEYLIEHLDDHDSIQELGARVGLNEYTLRTGFKQLFGKPPFAFALDQRMERAKRLIAETNLPVKTIAEMTRYGSVSSFINAFRQKFGIAPGRLRNERF